MLREINTDFTLYDLLKDQGSAKTLIKIGSGNPIFNQGDVADSVYYILSGIIKIVVVSQSGKEAILAIHGRDNFFGEDCLIGQQNRTASAYALIDAEIVRIDRANLSRLIHDEPCFSEKFSYYLLARKSRIESDLIDRHFSCSEMRLIRALILLADVEGNGNSRTIISKISQETLADMVGTTRSRISFFMNKFRRMGLVNYGGDIEIDRARLSAMLPQYQNERFDTLSASL